MHTKCFRLQENFKGIVITRSYTFFVKHCNFQEIRKCVPFVFCLLKEFCGTGIETQNATSFPL